MLSSFATITLKPQHFMVARAAVEGIVTNTRAEPGCCRFELFSDSAQSKLFILEQWDNQAAFDFHHAQAYTKEVFAAYEQWLEKAPVLQPLEPIA